MITNLTEIARLYNAIPTTVSETLMKESGLLATMNFDMASAGEKDVFGQFESLPSAEITNYGEGLEGQSISAENSTLTLAYITALHREIADDVKNAQTAGLTLQAYFAMKAPLFYASLAQKFAAIAFYGSEADAKTPFKGFKEIAKANGETIDVGGVSGASTSIFAIRWKPQMCTGLYNAAMVMVGQLITSTWRNNGQMYTLSESNKEFDYYGMKHILNLGVKVTSKELVGCITGIDATHSPTTENVNDLIDIVKADSNTFLYGNRRGRKALNALKEDYLQTTNSDSGVNTFITTWGPDAVPFVIDDNITNTETTDN